MKDQKTIRNVAAWTNAELTAGLLRQINSMAACEIALGHLYQIAHQLEATKGRNPRDTIKALAADSYARALVIGTEAKKRGIEKNLESEGLLPIQGAVAQAVHIAKQAKKGGV